MFVTWWREYRTDSNCRVMLVPWWYEHDLYSNCQVMVVSWRYEFWSDSKYNFLLFPWYYEHRTISNCLVMHISWWYAYATFKLLSYFDIDSMNMEVILTVRLSLNFDDMIIELYWIANLYEKYIFTCTSSTYLLVQVVHIYLYK